MAITTYWESPTGGSLGNRRVSANTGIDGTIISQIQHNKLTTFVGCVAFVEDGTEKVAWLSYSSRTSGSDQFISMRVACCPATQPLLKTEYDIPEISYYHADSYIDPLGTLVVGKQASTPLLFHNGTHICVVVPYYYTYSLTTTKTYHPNQAAIEFRIFKYDATCMEISDTTLTTTGCSLGYVLNGAGTLYVKCATVNGYQGGTSYPSPMVGPPAVTLDSTNITYSQGEYLTAIASITYGQEFPTLSGTYIYGYSGVLVTEIDLVSNSIITCQTVPETPIGRSYKGYTVNGINVQMNVGPIHSRISYGYLKDQVLIHPAASFTTLTSTVGGLDLVSKSIPLVSFSGASTSSNMAVYTLESSTTDKFLCKNSSGNVVVYDLVTGNLEYTSSLTSNIISGYMGAFEALGEVIIIYTSSAGTSVYAETTGTHTEYEWSLAVDATYQYINFNISILGDQIIGIGRRKISDGVYKLTAETKLGSSLYDVDTLYGSIRAIGKSYYYFTSGIYIVVIGKTPHTGDFWVESTDPADGDTNEPVLERQVIKVTFNKEVDETTVGPGNLDVYDEGGLDVKYEVSRVDDVDLYLLTAGPYHYNATYTCYARVGLKDTDDEPLEAEYPWDFSTAANTPWPYVVTDFPDGPGGYTSSLMGLTGNKYMVIRYHPISSPDPIKPAIGLENQEWI